jgi:hypothetical protein
MTVHPRPLRWCLAMCAGFVFAACTGATGAPPAATQVAASPMTVGPSRAVSGELDVTFTGTVRDPSGAPVRGIAVNVDGPTVYDLPGGTSRADGRFEFRHVLETAAVTLVAFQYGYTEDRVAVDVTGPTVVADFVVSPCVGEPGCASIAPAPTPMLSGHESDFYGEIFEWADASGAISRDAAMRLASEEVPVVDAESDAYLVIFDPHGEFEPPGSDLIGRRVWLVRASFGTWVLLDAATGARVGVHVVQR